MPVSPPQEAQISALEQGNQKAIAETMRRQVCTLLARAAGGGAALHLTRSPPSPPPVPLQEEELTHMREEEKRLRAKLGTVANASKTKLGRLQFGVQVRCAAWPW
jgi:hypothetical protein